MTATTILIIVALAAGILIALVALSRRRPAPRAPESRPYVASRERPYMKEGAGIADEAAAATTDVAGEVLGLAVVRRPAGPADDLQRLKGVGPKFVARLGELGITRFDQLAGLNANEAAHLDERLGPFQGRLARDRLVEQADYLARGDVEGFEERFGNLGG